MPSSSRPPPTTDRLSQVWQSRTDMVKEETAAANKAADAKTARLKALRLAKEAEDAAAKSAEPAPQKRGKRGE
jgi:hypothetical protein